MIVLLNLLCKKNKTDGIAKPFLVCFLTLFVDTPDNLSTYLVKATYSNLENHPRLIRARDTQKATKIQLDPKTGLPFVRPTVDMKPQSTEIPESDPNRRK